MIYLFKNRLAHQDVFTFLYEEMVRRGFECVRFVDDEEPDVGVLDSLKGREITLLSADHLNNATLGTREISTNSIVKMLQPVKKFYAMHDIGIHYVDDDVSGWHALIPHECFAPLFRGRCVYSVVGHPKFHGTRSYEYDAIFFPSLLYVYIQRPVRCWFEDFGPILAVARNIKFPDWKPAAHLIEEARHRGFVVLPPKEESFSFIMKTKTSITNSASSIAVEACMAGCRSVNIGAGYGPPEVYGGFDIEIYPDTPTFAANYHKRNPTTTMKTEMIFDVEKAISIVTK